jgi:hypothetical protein
MGPSVQVKLQAQRDKNFVPVPSRMQLADNTELLCRHWSLVSKAQPVEALPSSGDHRCKQVDCQGIKRFALVHSPPQYQQHNNACVRL